MAQYGGTITVQFSTGPKIRLRGTWNIMPSGVSNEAMTNQNGSVDKVSTPVPRRFEMTFADDGLDFDDLMRGDNFNVSCLERDNGVTHYFTDCFLVGEPTINRLTGEVTGLSGAANKYNSKGR